MLLTFQFPLFDVRYLRPEVARISRPDWSSPANDEQVRYMGPIVDRNGTYRGPWDGESKYCSAHKVINFCGDGPGHFFPAYYKKTKILYRRVQSDGNSLVHFQVGLHDRIDEDGKVEHHAVEDRIKDYLALKVKIRIGNKLSDFVSLAECGKYLKESYYWATTKAPKSFNPRDLRYQIEEGDPMILVEYNSDKVIFPEATYTSIDNKSIRKSSLKLQFGSLVHKINAQKSRPFKTWLIGHSQAQSVLKSDFTEVSKSLKHLRINLLRVHSESFVMKRIGDFTTNIQEEKYLDDPKVRKRITLLLVKQFENMSRVRRFNYQQDEILGLVYKDDPGQSLAQGFEKLLQESDRAYSWLSNLQQAEELQGSIRQIKDYYRAIKTNIDPDTPEIYFSYAWGNGTVEEGDREKIVNELYDSLNKNNYKTKRDKKNEHGSLISEFMQQIGKSYLVIVFLSDKYLRSIYCMHELYEIFRNSKLETELFLQKVILIPAEDSLKEFDDYNQYWKKKATDETLTKVEKERIAEIDHHFEDLYSILRDSVTKSAEILRQDDFLLVRGMIDKRLGL